MIALLAAVALGAPLLLDAGGAGSPVLADFVRLDPTGCADPRVSWASPPRTATWQGGPDALAGDFVDGGVLHLALDPGPWTFHVLIGQELRGYLFPVPIGGTFGVRVDGADVLSEAVPTGDAFLASSWYAAAPFPVFRPGETAWDRQIAVQHTWRTVHVDVPAGGIDVEVFGVPLQGLIALPSADEAEGEVLRAVADAHRRAWFHERVDTLATTWTWPFPVDGPLRASSGTWLDLPDPSGGASSAGSGPTQGSAPTNEPGGGALAPVVERAVAPGERVGLVWWLFPGDGAADVVLEGLEGLDPALYEVHALDAAHHSMRTVRPRPAFLRPTEGALRGGQGFPVGVAVIGRVPDDAPPGLLTGHVRVTRGTETLDLPVHLRVRDLDLADPPAPVGVFADLRQPLTLAYGSGAPEVWAAYDRDVAMMRAHGFSVLGLRFAAPWPTTWAPGTPPDTSLFAEAATRWRAAGGDALVWLDPMPWALEGPYRDPRRKLDAPGLRALLHGVALAAVAHDAFVYAYDEGALRGFDQVPRAVAVADALRAEVPDVRLAAGELHPLGWTLADPYDVLMLSVTPPVSSAIVDAVRGDGASPWLYNQIPGRAGAGLLPYVTGADATIAWHWNDTQGDPFHDAHARRQWAFGLLAPGGADVWPTTLLEAYADGVDDQRYLATLEALVTTAEARKRRVAAAAVPGRRLLDVVAQIDGAPQLGIVDGGVWSETDLTRLRDAVGDAAEDLSRCLDKRRACPRPMK